MITTKIHSCVALSVTILFVGLAFLFSIQTTDAQTTIQDGDLIRVQGTNDIYIVKIINNKQFKD